MIRLYDLVYDDGLTCKVLVVLFGRRNESANITVLTFSSLRDGDSSHIVINGELKGRTQYTAETTDKI
jgi:hypothetical protein